MTLADRVVVLDGGVVQQVDRRRWSMIGRSIEASRLLRLAPMNLLDGTLGQDEMGPRFRPGMER